ncbi:hypothetical protein [Haloarchaeobius sp. DT45]|uniref:hypothetical protein n=1 Tax=Haloarchaeobius sp. DT45 TaxID=3446116 RepID=UPI003F6B56D3
MRPSLRAASVVVLVATLALLPASAPVTATGGPTDPVCPPSQQFDGTDAFVPENESGNVSILAYGVGPNVSNTALRGGNADPVEPVPLDGTVVVEVRAPNIATADEAPTVRFSWRCLSLDPDEETVLRGASDDVVYLLYDDLPRWDVPDEADDTNVSTTLYLPDSYPVDDGYSRPSDRVEVRLSKLELAQDGPVHVRPTKDATFGGWSGLELGAAATLTLERNGSVLAQESLELETHQWQTTVDLSAVPNGSRLAYRLMHDGETHDYGIVVVDETPVSIESVQVLEDVRAGDDLPVSVVVRHDGLDEDYRNVTARIVDAENGVVIDSDGGLTRIPASGTTERTFELTAPPAPGSYEVEVSLGDRTVTRTLIVHGTDTATPDQAAQTTATPSTSTVPASDLTFAEDPGSSEIPGFGVLSAALALAMVGLRARH